MKKVIKNSLIELTTIGEYKRTHSFEINHALKLLRLPNSMWRVTDENYQFTDNDIKRRKSEGKDTTAEK